MNKIDIKGLYHNHTKYSKFNHGKSTTKQMVNYAENANLVQLGITDHGPKHIFGIRNKNIKKLKAEIDEINKTSKTKILMGLELNLLGCNGECDLKPEFEEFLDIRLLGVHKAGMVNLKNFFKFVLPNLFNKNSVKTINRNTDAYIQAIKKYKIDIITHPMEYFKVDIKKLAEACVENNCYLELNNKHLCMTKDDIAEALKTDVKFVISSDAHRANDILNIDKVLEFADSCGISEDRIANLGQIPDFKNKYKKNYKREI